MNLTAGTRFGSYEIVSPFGAGGMGEVYKARDLRLDRLVAIKVLPAALAVDPQFRERFDREARTISQLDHPHICALFDVGEEVPSTGSGQGVAYLVMQYLEGSDVWLLDIRRGIASTFSVNPAAETHGVWSPDGARITFQSDRDGARYYDLFEKPAVGGEATLLLKSDQDKTALDWSRDGRLLLFRSRSKETKSDLFTLTMTGERKAAPFLVTPFDEEGACFSPDGRWIAYQSDESGQVEV
jgi:hypothetical protein